MRPLDDFAPLCLSLRFGQSSQMSPVTQPMYRWIERERERPLAKASLSLSLSLSLFLSLSLSLSHTRTFPPVLVVNFLVFF